jgi:hypothetical protein
MSPAHFKVSEFECFEAFAAIVCVYICMYVCSRHVIVILLYTDDIPHYFKYIAYIYIFSTNLTKTCQNMYACMANV